MATDAMPEQHVMDGARPRGGTTHMEAGTLKERSCNLDKNCPPWERPQDWTTRKFTKAYCEKLDKANNVTGIGTEFYLYPCRNPSYYDRDDRPTEIESEHEGSFLVKPPDGKGDVVNLGKDLVMMAIPMRHRKEQEKRDKEVKEARESGQRVNLQTGQVTRPPINQHMTPSGGQFPAEQWEQMTIDERIAMKEEISRYHHETGMVGGSSPTAGMPLMEAELAMRRRGIDPRVESERYRLGPRAAPKTQEEMVDILLAGRSAKDPIRARMLEEVKRNEKPRSYSNSGVGFAPEINPRSALGQVRNRAGKGK